MCERLLSHILKIAAATRACFQKGESLDPSPSFPPEPPPPHGRQLRQNLAAPCGGDPSGDAVGGCVVALFVARAPSKPPSTLSAAMLSTLMASPSPGPKPPPNAAPLLGPMATTTWCLLPLTQMPANSGNQRIIAFLGMACSGISKLCRVFASALKYGALGRSEPALQLRTRVTRCCVCAGEHPCGFPHGGPRGISSHVYLGRY